MLRERALNVREHWCEPDRSSGSRTKWFACLLRANSVKFIASSCFRAVDPRYARSLARSSLLSVAADHAFSNYANHIFFLSTLYPNDSISRVLELRSASARNQKRVLRVGCEKMRFVIGELRPDSFAKETGARGARDRKIRETRIMPNSIRGKRERARFIRSSLLNRSIKSASNRESTPETRRVTLLSEDGLRRGVLQQTVTY